MPMPPTQNKFARENVEGMKRGRATDDGAHAGGGGGGGGGGEEAWARSLRVRRIVKENHGEEIAAAAFNRVDPAMAHMLATVGGRQLNIYDNEHRGDHLDLVSHYVDDAAGNIVRADGTSTGRAQDEHGTARGSWRAGRGCAHAVER